MACEYGRYGYRRVTALLKTEGWHINHKRVERIWRKEGLKVPKRQPKRRRLWFNDGSCIRLRPEYKDHVWSYDFVADRTSNGKPLRMLNVIDEYTRECLAIRIDRKITSTAPSEDALHRNGKSMGEWILESFRRKFRDELLNGVIFDAITEAKVVTERWRNTYHKIRPHSSLNYRPPAPETFYPLQLASA